MAPGYDKCLSSGVNRVIDHHLSLVSGQQEILRMKKILTIPPDIIFERQLIFCSHSYGPCLRLRKCFCSRKVAGALVRFSLPCIAKVPKRIYNTLLIHCLSGDFENLFRSTPGPFGLVSPNFGRGHCLASAGLMFFLQFQFTFLKSSLTWYQEIWPQLRIVLLTPGQSLVCSCWKYLPAVSVAIRVGNWHYEPIKSADHLPTSWIFQ